MSDPNQKPVVDPNAPHPAVPKRARIVYFIHAVPPLTVAKAIVKGTGPKGQTVTDAFECDEILVYPDEFKLVNTGMTDSGVIFIPKANTRGWLPLEPKK